MSLRRPMLWEPFIEANLGPILPSRPLVVRNSNSSQFPYHIPAVQHRTLEYAVQDLLDCRERLVGQVMERQRQERYALHQRHKAERGE